MSETGHTPGPWTARVGSREHVRYVEGPHEQAGVWLLAEVCGRFDGENEANARLIAAAPDLLQACKLLLSNVTVDCPSARAAIAKAEGR